ncbi:VOC family protein [Paenibacillus sp. LHD-117]|uniref:VOC family protein n=1 Tax=Paenibacillus sp. LHD-117 TaxID=3071412 RepID=UPI0027E1E9D3|nr:VOC family protein [Paenibacillus sp. LHD-117]MDQ6423548.1 VOC family protein [Paenibacillus sp. LHD-117]
MRVLDEDARSQAAFYAESFGGQIMSVSTHGELMGTGSELKDKVMHLCVVVAGGHAIFMADAIEPVTQGTDISLALEYDSEPEASAAFAKIAVGGRVKYPIEMQPFGVYYGELTDKFGISWMITAAPKAAE